MGRLGIAAQVSTLISESVLVRCSNLQPLNVVDNFKSSDLTSRPKNVL
jgi:hypothetical protein